MYYILIILSLLTINCNCLFILSVLKLCNIWKLDCNYKRLEFLQIMHIYCHKMRERERERERERAWYLTKEKVKQDRPNIFLHIFCCKVHMKSMFIAVFRIFQSINAHIFVDNIRQHKHNNTSIVFTFRIDVATVYK